MQRIFILLFTTSFFIPGLFALEGDINLDNTSDYIERLHGRGDFPISNTFAYYYTYSKLAIEGDLEDETILNITSFIRKTQNPDGGLRSGGPSVVDSTTLDTYYGLRTMAILDSLGTLDRVPLIDYLKSAQNPDGGFAYKPGGDSQLPSTLHSLYSLYLLNGLSEIDQEKARHYVLDKKATDGGFSTYGGGLSTIKPTYEAVLSLVLLDSLGEVDIEEVKSFLQATQYLKFKGTNQTGYPKTENLNYALAAMDAMDAINEVNKTYVLNFLNVMYIKENGGFGPQTFYGATPPSTYHGVAALVSMGELDSPIENIFGMGEPLEKSTDIPPTEESKGICGPTIIMIISSLIICARIYLKN